MSDESKGGGDASVAGVPLGGDLFAAYASGLYDEVVAGTLISQAKHEATVWLLTSSAARGSSWGAREVASMVVHRFIADMWFRPPGGAGSLPDSRGHVAPARAAARSAPVVATATATATATAVPSAGVAGVPVVAAVALGASAGAGAAGAGSVTAVALPSPPPFARVRSSDMDVPPPVGTGRVYHPAAHGRGVAITIEVPNTTRDLYGLLGLVVELMYRGGEVPGHATPQHVCDLLKLFWANAKGSRATAAVYSLSTVMAKKITGVDMQLDWLPELLYAARLPSAVLDVLRDVQRLSRGWVCAACSQSNKNSLTKCGKCHKERQELRPGELPLDLDPAFFAPPPEEMKELEALTPTQRKAVNYVVSTSQRASNSSRGMLLSRLTGLGYSEVDLQRTLRFVRDTCPIIVHFKAASTFQFFVRDTHYRNQFETSTSGGCLSTSSRINWENRLFNKVYTTSCSGFDRVKYGVLNMVKDPSGVACCAPYGESYLELKNVRLRTTFADQDTSSPTSTLATCEYYCHVLAKYNEAELRSVVDVATGRCVWKPSSCVATYKEVQIHGELRLADHVKRVVVNASKSDATIRNHMTKFTAKHGVPCVYMEDLKREVGQPSGDGLSGGGSSTGGRRPGGRTGGRGGRGGRTGGSGRTLGSGEWSCARCSVKNAATAGTCKACSLARAIRGSSARPFKCGACSVDNVSATHCRVCGTAAPTWTCGACGVENPNANNRCAVCSTNKGAAGSAGAAGARGSGATSGTGGVPWTCTACTFKNPGGLKCGMCEAPRPALASSAAAPAAAPAPGGSSGGAPVAAGGIPWTCALCTTVNVSHSMSYHATCSTCGAPRS